MPYLTKEETKELDHKAEAAGLTIVGHSVGGTPFVSFTNLPPSDPGDFEVNGPYNENHAPYGVTLMVSAETYVKDMTNPLMEYPRNEGEDRLFLYNSTTVTQPDVLKPSFLVRGNVTGYGYHETYEAALEEARRVLTAERTGCIVENSLQMTHRLAHLALHEANRPF